jgi:hypothetical protein
MVPVSVINITVMRYRDRYRIKHVIRYCSRRTLNIGRHLAIPVPGSPRTPNVSLTFLNLLYKSVALSHFNIAVTGTL